MSDLIDRQLVLDRINKQREHLRPYLYPQDKIGDSAYRICAEFVERIPSAEPEIIRCKDCKYYLLGSDGIPFCFKHDGDVLWQDNDFCSKSERRTDE